ncbi:Fibroleukin [Mactra antiquata]
MDTMGMKWQKFATWNFCIIILSIGCHGNSVPYKHLSLEDNEILVDKIVSLEADGKDPTKVVKIVTTDFSLENTRHPHRNRNKQDSVTNSDLKDIIAALKNEITEMKESQLKDRETIQDLNKKLQTYHNEMMIGTAEVVQIRQLVTENYDKTVTLGEETQDNSILMEGMTLFQKEANKEIRRFKEYKERAAKRFHQLTNQVEKCQENVVQLQTDLKNITQEFRAIQHSQGNITSELNSLRDLSWVIQSDLNETISNITSCCNTQPILTNQNAEYSTSNNKFQNPSNQKQAPSKLTNHIEILNFGSGEVYDEYGSQLEEGTNSIDLGNYYSNSENGSGETVSEGSGELGSGDTELPPLRYDLKDYIHRDIFNAEKMKWEGNFMDLSMQYENITRFMEELDTRVRSIQLGNFMQNLQESLINFTQNVITLDQWKISSNQIVNSTIYNQDQIVKLTNMVVENADKVVDLNRKVANGDLLSSQQYMVLKRYVIQLNNSVEDIKEQLQLSERRQHSLYNTQYQATYYRHQTGYHSSENRFEEDQSTGPNNNLLNMMKSQLDDLGLQIVFNQNRLGNLEVKLLNESLYSCRKYNIDAYQDSQLANQELVIKSNTQSIMLIHNLVKELDDTVRSVYMQMKYTERKIKVTSGNLDSLRGIIPAMVGIKKEVDNFLFTLPTDCDGYFNRGFRKTGVYVIHPFTASTSIQVMCHMTDHVTRGESHVADNKSHMIQNGGWTVIQRRFDGSVDFKKNWTDYRTGFGHVDGEYWLGNYYINLLTSHKNYSLEIEMIDTEDNLWIAMYDNFSVNLPDDKYTLFVSGYSGNATDAMSYISNMGFSTMDRDNDASSTNCAYYYESGWWFKSCQTFNLNGRYNIGFYWFNHDEYDWLRLKSSVLRIKPHSEE